jgi:hypothetical protein
MLNGEGFLLEFTFELATMTNQQIFVVTSLPSSLSIYLLMRICTGARHI